MNRGEFNIENCEPGEGGLVLNKIKKTLRRAEVANV